MLFDAYSPVFFLLIAATAFFTSYIANQALGLPAINHRESALDGLRGFLVVGVFVHHASFWISKKGGGEWKVPDGVLSTIGPTCVIMFFMTTAFLYYSKLLRNGRNEMDWLHIVLSRVLRLMPLCIFMAIVAFTIALFATEFLIKDGLLELAQTFVQWSAAGLGGSPDINGLASSWQINAGVVWTLKYEILFYVSLPILGVLAHVKASRASILISFALAVLILETIRVAELRLAAAFLGGIVGAYAAQRAWIARFFQSSVAALIFLACVLGVLLSNRNAYGAVSLILLTLAFAIVACGNDIFGILSLQSVRAFGDIGYSAYLLHGILLYLSFHSKNLAPFDGAADPLKHWLIVMGITVLLVFICRLTFKYIELPSMNAEPYVRSQIKALVGRVRSNLMGARTSA